MTNIFEKKPELEFSNNHENDEPFENIVFQKLKTYFELHKILKHENLNEFLDSIHISDVFETYEEKEVIWGIFTNLSEGATEINYETCKKGLTDLFAFYSGSEEERVNTTESNYADDNRFSEGGAILNRSSSVIIKNQLRESIQKENNLDDLVLRITPRKNKKIRHYNTAIISRDSGFRDSNFSEVSSPNFNESSKSLTNSALKKKKIHHQRKITKLFTEVDIEKLQQLRKIFSILGLRNKENVYISEIQEVINKYKFIKLTQDELINFLSLISDDFTNGETFSNGKNLNKLSINFELYSRAMCAIEKQLLQFNTDTFSERNDSYHINDNCSEMIEDLNNTELESIDYVMVLADILKSIEYRVYDSIFENYEKILSGKYQTNENEESIRELINEGEQHFKNKLRDMEIFLREMNGTFTKKQNKLAYLKLIVNRMEDNLKNAEDDYRILFQKFNTNQNVEINDETEKLIEENLYLNEQRQQKNNQIEILQKQTGEKDEQIFNLESRLDNLLVSQRDLDSAYNNLKNNYENLQKNYDIMLNQIYENITKHEDNQTTKNVDKEKTSLNLNEKDTIIKLREKLIVSEQNKKLFDMNYEQLILYTLNIETINQQLEETNKFNNMRIKELENELRELNKSNNEIAKSLHMLKSENTRLLSKINDLNKDVEFNQIFRPSNVLGNRISKMSEDRKSNLFISSRLKNVQKMMEMENNINNTNDSQEKKNEFRISQMIFEENLQFNYEVRKKTKLEQVEQNQNLEINNNPLNMIMNPNNKSIAFDNPINSFAIMSTNITLEPQSLTNTNEIFSKKDSFLTNEKFLFDDKRLEKVNTFTSLENDSQSNNNTNEYHKPKVKFNEIIEESDKREKEIIVDCLDEHVVMPTDHEIDKHNVSVNMESIVRHSPLVIDINLDKREKLKQMGGINGKVNQVSKNYSKFPSFITEEILEEDANGEIIGTGIGNSIRRSDRKTLSNQSISNLSLQMEKNNIGLHSRGGTIEDLGLVFNKDSQYVCYDFLTLRKTEQVSKMLEDNREDVSSYEMFSDNVYLINEDNKKTKKYLFITSNYVYILRPNGISSKIRINLKKLDKITISNKNCNLIAFHFIEGDDLLLEILRRMELLYYFRDLYRLKRYGKLKFKYADNFKIKRNNSYSNIIVNQANNFFIAPNFDNAQKLGYLSKLTGTFFTKFTEKLVVLTNVGLLYFDDPNKPPKKLIPIIGSSILKIEEKKYKKKFCFEIKTLNGDNYVFATNSVEELESWMMEFRNFKKIYENKIKNIDNKK